jgi:hypothetical protein
MIVFQPIWGELPKKYEHCVASAIKFCDKIGAEYVSPELPEEYKDWKYLENVKDYMLYRLMAKTPYVLGIDWDILLNENFCIDNIENPQRGTDVAALIYNGSNVEMFKEIVRRFEEYPISLAKNELSRAWKSAHYYIVSNPIKFFDPNSYLHLNNI